MWLSWGRKEPQTSGFSPASMAPSEQLLSTCVKACSVSLGKMGTSAKGRSRNRERVDRNGTARAQARLAETMQEGLQDTDRDTWFVHSTSGGD